MIRRAWSLSPANASTVGPEPETSRPTASVLPTVAPGRAVEVRIPPFAAVQCVAGPRHTRGTPPNVVETDPSTWLRLATGLLDWDRAVASGAVTASGTRAAEVADLLPVVRPRW